MTQLFPDLTDTQRDRLNGVVKALKTANETLLDLAEPPASEAVIDNLCEAGEAIDRALEYIAGALDDPPTTPI
jgi:hypothetical protein